MRRNTRFFRLTASVAITALLWDITLPPAAFAQPAPPPIPQLYTPQSQTDPPARVGRIARINGTVSFHNQGDADWSPASVNYPVSTGEAFWTEPASTTELEISDSRIVLAPATQLDIATLDTNGVQAVAAQGETYLHLRDLTSNETWVVQTPRGLVRLGGPGRYDFIVGSTEQPTLVTVVDGSADIEGAGMALHIGSGQTATIAGSDTLQGSVGPAVRDPFLTATLNAERPSAAVPVPAPVVAMPGGSDLAGYGNWAPAPEFGQVWYPPVSPDWVPYRDGHWAYVAPWGWTWIDDAPWGFAPFHYGRWIEIDGRWAWTPGSYAADPPVYAPALVTFIGIGAGIAVGAALAAGTIGWIPLGPHEPFHPWYRASDRYRQQINVNHATNINNTVTLDNYINRRAATAIPGSAMATSRPVQSVVQPVTPQQIAIARPIMGQQPVRPTAQTAGLTPAVARQFQLDQTVRSAPGPAIRSASPGVGGIGSPRTGIGVPRPDFHAPGVNPPIYQPPSPGLPRPNGPRFGTPEPAIGAPLPFVRPEPTPVRPEGPHADYRPLPRVVTPHPIEQHEHQPSALSRPEPPRFLPPTPVPHAEPPRFAPPAPRSEPPRPAASAPEAHEKRSGER